MENCGVSTFMCNTVIERVKKKNGLDDLLNMTGTLMLKTESAFFEKGYLTESGRKEKEEKHKAAPKPISNF